uniref:E3 ubiquitin-protein ligase RBBP6 n=1 Tax=Anthurium amnicola TaxID=1678845 RepID=A0A1D1XN31_9ARAE
MWIHYRFRHALRWEKRLPITGCSISFAELESAIIAVKLSSLLKEKTKKSYRLLAEARLLIYNAHTGEEYGGDNEEIPANTSVIVRLLTPWSTAFLESKRAFQSETELRSSIAEEECKQNTVKRAIRPLGSVWHYLKSPPGYICHRCQVPGHYIQACPTNGDPNYDIKGPKHPTDVSEATSEKNFVSLTVNVSSRRSMTELNCPLCKEVMKEAVLIRKCCFSSFCEKCIRDRITSGSVCACGATNISVDDLVPNKTLRETIKRFLSSTSDGSENDRSCCLQARGSETSHHSQTAAHVPTILKSASTKGSKESAAVSGVTDPLVGEASKQLDACTSELLTAHGSIFPLSLATPNVEFRQKGEGVGSRKRVSSDRNVSSVKVNPMCSFCMSGYVYVLFIFVSRKFLYILDMFLYFVFGAFEIGG